MRTMRIGMAVLGAALAMAGTAQAALVVEDFDYTTGTNPPSWNGGSGWSGAWAHGATSTTVITAQPGNLTTAVGGYSITQSDSAHANGSTSSAFRGANRNLASSMSGEVWFSVLFQNTTTSGRSGIQFNNARTNDYDEGTYDVRLAGTGLIVRYNNTDTTNVATLTTGTTHLIVGQWTIDNTAGANDTLKVWADPADLQNLGTPQFNSGTADLGVSGLTRVGIVGYSNPSGTAGNVDALRVSNNATAFTDVTGVTIPEPASMALLGLAGVVLLRQRCKAV